MKVIRLILIVAIQFMTIPSSVFSWSEHPMLIYPILRDMPEITQLPQVEVKSLRQFLTEEEQGLAEFLAEHEQWARTNIRQYAPRPDHLAFNAGDDQDIIGRFLQAIRVNPEVKLLLYLHLLPGEDCGLREYINPHELTTLSDPFEMLFATYVCLYKGETVSPLYVLATATDEPDYGFDLGLFEDNNTWWGRTYEFGEQAFGNPDLAYSSQAPFHMGFYHESWLVFAAAPFLKRTFVEYRIHLYKSLATYAFQNGQDYWGWRFLGWATHYLNDMSMPYHTSVLPGRSSLGMIWINLKAMLGFPRSRDNAVQLVSNRHTVYEHFQWEVLRETHQEKKHDHPFIQALLNPIDHVEYNNDFPRNVAARESARLARRHDRLLRRYVPGYLVSDPDYPISSSAELEGLVELIRDQKGEAAVEGLTAMIAERFRSLSMHTRSFVLSVIDES